MSDSDAGLPKNRASREFSELVDDLTSEESEELEMGESEIRRSERARSPTMIVRAEKALARAREARKLEAQLGKTIVFDLDGTRAQAEELERKKRRRALISRVLSVVVAMLTLGCFAAVFMELSKDSSAGFEAIEVSPIEPLPAQEPQKQAEAVPAPAPDPDPVPVPAPAAKEPEKEASSDTEIAPPEKEIPPPTKEAARKVSRKRARAKVREPSKAAVATTPSAPVQETARPPEPDKLPSAAPEDAYLTIKSSPSGAMLEIDGVALGRAPTDRLIVPPGRHWISATLAGHEIFIDDVELRAGEHKIFEAKLVVIPRLEIQ